MSLPLMSTSALAAPGDADAAFEALYEKEWAWRQEQEIGWGGAVPAHFPDVSAKAQAEKLAYWQGVQEKLDDIDPADLSAKARVDYEVYTAQIEDLVQGQKFHEYEIPLNSAGGFWTYIGYITDRPFRTEEDYRNYLTLLSETPVYFEQQTENMEAGLARGFTPAKVAIDGRDISIAAVAEEEDPTELSLYDPFEEMPDALPDDVKAALREEAIEVIESDVIPAYAEFLDFFRTDYLPNARTTLGATEYPDGEAYYDWKVRQYTTLDMTPDEVHEIGLKEVAKIKAQMFEVMEEAGFEGDFAEFLTFLRTDPQFYAETPEEYLYTAAWISKQFDGKVNDYFGRPPRSRFTISPFPPEIAPYTTGAAGGRFTYWLNTYNLSSRPLYSLRALTLHESAPGHAWQQSAAAENADHPDFRREVYISAYGEGWALYCEKLGVEMGMYETPYDMFGMLSYQMWRAARLVVDTGLHSKGWSRERAVKYLVDNTAIGEHEIGTEVDRYITNPGQAVSYYTGMMAIEESRAKAETALGPDFDIRYFHDTILSLGGVPLPVLKARIDRFIAEGGPSPYGDEG